jgi:hypothetical protein
MKKIIIGILVGFSCMVFAQDLSTRHLEYYWNFKTKSCSKTPFENKRIVLNDIRNGYMLLDQHFKNDAGEILVLLMEDNGKEYETLTFTTFGACRLYEDLIFKNMDVKASQYVGLQSYSDKPKPAEKIKD